MAPTMKDIAQRLGISITTVSHAINETRYVSETTKNRVKKAIEEMGYIPNELARGLKNKSSKTIGIIIPNISSFFFPELVRACEDVAYLNGYNTILCNSDESEKKEYLYCEYLRSKQVDGLILALSGKNTSCIVQLVKNLPIVFVDRYIDAVVDDYVGFDNEHAAYKAVKHLIGLGHKRIAFATTRKQISTTQERLQGYKKILEESGIPYNEDLVINTSINRNFDEIQKTFVTFLSARQLRPDCILATNGIATIAALAAFLELGLECPKNIGLMGFSDFSWSWIFQPHLSMVDLPVKEMGTRAMQLLINKIENPDPARSKQHVLLATELVIRDSCGALKGRTRSAFSHI
jgi:DNA-binding LacI/PurR family transcriptional regulator